MSRTDFIFDIETMGNNVFKIPMLDISFTTFKWDRFLSKPYTFDELTEKCIQTIKLDVKDQMKNYDTSYTKRDLEWWMKQGEDAKKAIQPKSDDVTFSEFREKFFGYLRDNPEIDYWWSRGNVFDPIVVSRLLWVEGEEYIKEYENLLPFWKVRDTRTYIDAKLDFPENGKFNPLPESESGKVIAHKSSHDVAIEILRMQKIVRIENDAE